MNIRASPPDRRDELSERAYMREYMYAYNDSHTRADPVIRYHNTMSGPPTTRTRTRSHTLARKLSHFQPLRAAAHIAQHLAASFLTFARMCVYVYVVRLCALSNACLCVFRE